MSWLRNRKRENMETNNFFTLTSIRKMVLEWNSQLVNASWCQRERERERERERWHRFPYIDTLSLICESGIVNDVDRRSRIEYLIRTDNILAFDWYFNLANRANFTGRLLIRFNTDIFDNLVLAYFVSNMMNNYHWKVSIYM